MLHGTVCQEDSTPAFSRSQTEQCRALQFTTVHCTPMQHCTVGYSFTRMYTYVQHITVEPDRPAVQCTVQFSTVHCTALQACLASNAGQNAKERLLYLAHCTVHTAHCTLHSICLIAHCTIPPYTKYAKLHRTLSPHTAHCILH